MRLNCILFLVITLALNACKLDSLEELDFFTVNTLDAFQERDTLIGVIRLEGQIDMKGTDVMPEIEDYGFLYATNYDELNNDNASGKVSLGSYMGDDYFFKTSVFLGLDSVLFVRAFATSKERKMKGEIREVNFNTQTKIRVLDRFNDSLKIEASLLNLFAEIKDFGFVIGKESPNVSLNKADFEIHYGNLDQDTTVEVIIGKFDFNTTYYLRPFYESETIKYGNTLPFRVTDGWIKKRSLPDVNSGAAYKSIKGLGYVLGGAGAIKLNEIIYAYYPNEDEWKEEGTIFDPFNLGVLELLGEKFVFGLGYDSIQPPLWFDYTSDPIFDYCEFIDTLSQAFNGVSFTIGEKVYFGTGAYNTEGSQLSDKFWELTYNGICYSIREMASLPIIGTDSDVGRGGREGAFTFEISGVHYVGGGYAAAPNATQLTDFYHFIPPQNESDIGAWELAGFLPGEARQDAVAFGLDDTGYYGFGFSFRGGTLSDFYRFDPGQGWKLTENFPGLPRSRAFAFGIEEVGYVGGGERKLIQNDNDILRPKLQDFWAYIPEENE